MARTQVPWTPAAVAPLDPNSEAGRRIAAGFGELIANVEDRLAREAAEAQIRTTA